MIYIFFFWGGGAKSYPTYKNKVKLNFQKKIEIRGQKGKKKWGVEVMSSHVVHWGHYCAASLFRLHSQYYPVVLAVVKQSKEFCMAFTASILRMFVS